MTLGDWLIAAERRLRLVGVDSPRLDAQLLAGHVLGQERSWVLTHLEVGLESDSEGLLEGFLGRRERREPLAYLLGWREFYGRRFAVGPGVLVPRPETEVLVEAVLEAGLGAGTRVLDVGTGSGCIAATLALERPDWAVTGVDVSDAALGFARRNGVALGAEVRWVLGDWSLVPGAFEVVVSNPPYIAWGEELMPEVGDFEPELALFAEEAGYAFYRRLAGCGAGLVWVEIGQGMEEGVASIFGAAGWEERERRDDLAGITRVMGFRQR